MDFASCKIDLGGFRTIVFVLLDMRLRLRICVCGCGLEYVRVESLLSAGFLQAEGFS